MKFINNTQNFISFKVVFITWQPYCSRSDNIAREFNGKSHKIYYDFFGSNYYTIIFKYGLQFIKTFLTLLRELPEIVFVMNPPVFACFPVYLYCKIRKKRFIIDMHTGALMDDIWQKVKYVQKFFTRHALFTIITNEEIGEELRKWGCDYKIIPDVPIRISKLKIPVMEGNLNITLVNTFSKDEPIINFLKATEKLQDINFYITGKINKKNYHFVKNSNKNIRFTGFLPENEFYGLLAASDLVVVLTTRDKTMQRGAYEAIYLGKPVVTSDWKVLRDNFSIGAVFVDNTISGIEEGIKKALRNIVKLNKEAINLRGLKYSIWKKNFNSIINDIEKSNRGKPAQDK